VAIIHVFAIDWVPEPSDIASGGGLRSLQVIEAVRGAGHTVTWSVPADCRHLRRIGRDSVTLRNVEIHSADTQLDLLKKLRPDIIMWLAPLSRAIPLTGLGDTVHVCDVVGLPHIEASLGAPGLERPLRERLGRLCRDADLVLTGSEEQNGYWLCELSRDGPPPPAAIVPYALPDSLRRGGAGGKSALVRVHVTGMVYAWSTSIRLLERIADWVAARNGITLSAIVGTDPGGATDRSVLQRLAAIGARPHVEMPGEVSFARAMADYGAGSLSLDIYEPNMERRMAVPIRTVNALTHGVPVLSTIDGTMMRRVQAEGAGWIASEPIEAALDRIAALPAAEIARMSKAARQFADREYGVDAAAKTLVSAIAAAVSERAERCRTLVAGSRPRASPARLPHVLVISNVEPHHRELRIDVPFNALFGQQAIGGYSVWSRGDFRFSTSSNLAEQGFDAIWVQRQISPEVALALRSLRRPFIYDIDDNLLATPGYRPPFPIELRQTVRNLIWSCSVLSCSTARLGQLLQSASDVDLVEKTIVTPNLLREPPPPRPIGKPRVLVWVSSDTPALTGSRADVVKAMRDFCLSYGMKLVCIGAEPPDLIAESEVDVLHIRQAPYGSYISLLRSFAPGIMACPLEANSAGGSDDFIDAKSDIKMLEVLAGGLTGVFSRARPYTESDLPRPILCDNSYRGWMEALREAWTRCGQASEAVAIPACRYASVVGTQPWLEAIEAARLPLPLSCAHFKEILAQWRGRYGRRLLSEAEFDADFYLTRYPDVSSVVSGEISSGAYRHYRQNGFREGRLGSPDDTDVAHNEHVWSNLFHTLGDLRTAVGNQARHLESLKARRATRLALKRQAGS
jgi:hypothetical protein